MSALIVTVDLPARIEQFRQVHVPTAADGVPPHVTLLYPFVPIEDFDEAVRDRVAAAIADEPPFSFRLAGIGRWPTSVYLRVEPSAPFERLVARLVEAFPAYPPYAGAYPYVPHLSLAEDDPDISLEALAADLDALAAVRHDVRRVELIARPVASWLVPDAFPLRAG